MNSLHSLHLAVGSQLGPAEGHLYFGKGHLNSIWISIIQSMIIHLYKSNFYHFAPNSMKVYIYIVYSWENHRSITAISFREGTSYARRKFWGSDAHNLHGVVADHCRDQIQNDILRQRLRFFELLNGPLWRKPTETSNNHRWCGFEIVYIYIYIYV